MKRFCPYCLLELKECESGFFCPDYFYCEYESWNDKRRRAPLTERMKLERLIKHRKERLAIMQKELWEMESKLAKLDA